MSAQTISELGTHVKLKQPYEVAVARAKAALKVEGFGVLTEIDVQETLKQKLGADFRRYVILGACNPPLSHRALSADLDVGLLLPCNVVVFETAPGESEVGLLNPLTLSAMFDNPAFRAIAQEAQERLDRVAASLRE